MRLDNKGITLVEIIVSVALIAIVIIFLFTLLIQINNENSDSEINSSYLINQSSFIKQIEEDIIEYNLQRGNSCRGEGVYLPRWNGDSNYIKCLTFVYSDATYSYGHLFLYKTSDNKTVLSYYRGDFKQSVELESFNWDINTHSIKIDNGEYKVYSLPIIGPDGNDYSINLSYTS